MSLSLSVTSTLGWYLRPRPGPASRVEHHIEPLLSNIRLGWKWLTITWPPYHCTRILTAAVKVLLHRSFRFTRYRILGIFWPQIVTKKSKRRKKISRYHRWFRFVSRVQQFLFHWHCRNCDASPYPTLTRVTPK